MLEYSPPKSFINWYPPKIKKFIYRLGTFIITPCNNVDNSEQYWCHSKYDDGFQTLFRKNYDIIFVSPKCSSEQEAIKLLENEIIKLCEFKIHAKNDELLKQIENNNDFLAKLKV